MSIVTRFKFKDRSGFSILEGIVTLAILSILSTAVYSFFSNLEKSARNISKGNICELHNAKVFSNVANQKLNPNSVKDFLYPEVTTLYNYTGVAPMPVLMRAPPMVQLRFDYFFGAGNNRLLYEILPGGDIGGFTVRNNGTMSYMPLLANNNLGYLADLYTQGGYTANAGYKVLPAVVVPAPDDATQNFYIGAMNQRYTAVTSMKLNLYQLDSRSDVADILPYFPMPPSQFPEKSSGSVVKYFPYSLNKLVMGKFPTWMREDLGIKVSLKTEIIDFYTKAKIQDCENFSRYEYPVKIQNVVDFGDFDAATYSGAGLPGGTAGGVSANSTFDYKFNFNARSVRVLSQKASNKTEILSPSTGGKMADTDPLAPIFTNYNYADPSMGRERNLCSQTGQVIPDFHIKFKVYNLDNDPGVIPICIDTSVQWLKSEVAGGGWCPRGGYSYADRSYVKINYDWKPGDLGWVPCESLNFCGQVPTSVQVVDGSDAKGKYLEYQYRYNVVADNNEAAMNRLWGCELKYKAASIDVAGNLSYPPEPKPDLTAASAATIDSLNTKLNPETIKEINPEIFFKPPPCYLCSCKKCSKGKGGFFGSFFALFVFIVLVIATGGAAYLALSGVLTTVLGVTAAICGMGGLGCETGSGGTTALTSPSGNQFTSCNDSPAPSHCKCGQTCTKKKVPAPRWSDTLVPNGSVNPALKTRCTADTLPTTLGPETTAVNVTRSYKVQMTAAEAAPLTVGADPQYVKVPGSVDNYYVMYNYNEDGTKDYRVVDSTDEVVWQEFDSSRGVYCTMRSVCNNGTWQRSSQPYTTYAANGDETSGSAAPEGCFKVKTAWSIDWDNKTLDKPSPKAAQCIEIDFPTGVFNETSDTLKGSTDLQFECTDVTSARTYVDPTGRPASTRIVGTLVPNVCVAPSTYTNASNSDVTVYLAAPPAQDIYDTVTDSDGNTTQVFRCHAQCVPPINLPQGPLSGEEQRYYQNYSAGSDPNLGFCRTDKTSFDSIK